MPEFHNKREKELEDIDMYDVLVPELRDQYHSRLQGVSDFLDTKMNYTYPEERATRKYILEQSGVRGGQTNFWANPYQDFPRKTPTNIQSTNWPVVGAVRGDMPTTVFVNPKIGSELRYPSGSLLAHEALHTRQSIADVRKAKGQLPLEFDYKPRFSHNFLKELEIMAKAQPQSPYYQAGGFGVDLDETMSYFLGREGQLPKGKSLRNDYYTKHIWDKYPGMYEEYVRARDLLRKTVN